MAAVPQDLPPVPPAAPRLAAFVQRLARLHDEPPPGGEAGLLAAARPLLADLVGHDDWLPESCAQPHPVHYQQYLLHADPADRFSVVSFVWGPGQRTPVHNHTVWGLIGMLRGAERGERYAPPQPGRPLVPLGEDLLTAGDVDAVSPTLGDVHRVSNAVPDRCSISIHVYGGNIGRITRQVFDPATGQPKAFVSGYTPPVALPPSASLPSP